MFVELAVWAIWKAEQELIWKAEQELIWEAEEDAWWEVKIVHIFGIDPDDLPFE